MNCIGLLVLLGLRAIGNSSSSVKQRGKVGKKYKSDSSNDLRVVSGEDAEDGEFPFMVSLQRYNVFIPFCGASLLSPTIVLSAAHCFGPQVNPSDIVALAGTVDGYGFYGLSPHAQRRTAEMIWTHPDFIIKPLSWDLAILKTEPFIPDGIYIEPFPLFKFPNLSWIYDQAQYHPPCIGLGWGSSDPNRLPPVVLQKVDLQLRSRTDCATSLKVSINTRVSICAVGGLGKDTCQGDSGGPLYCQMEPGWKHIIVAVVSTGYGCARRNLPAVYARLDVADAWIRDKLNNCGTQGLKRRMSSRIAELLFAFLIYCK